ncbi:MAG: aspartyl/asparaginyl beta-hydroxylase domain-containing protein [Panacagrimonas sp.]
MNPSTSITAAAREALLAGRSDEAEGLCENHLASMPDDADALALLGTVLARRGAVLRAVQVLSQAIAVQPEHVVALTQLGLVLKDAGNSDGAINAFQRALRLQPAAYVTRLHLGAVLEARHEPHRALRTYLRAIQDAQKQGRWLDPATTDEALGPAVRNALKYVNRGRREFFFGRVLEPLRAEFGPDALRRVEHCLSIWLGDVSAEWTDPRQRPTFLYFPGPPPSPYLDRALFPWMEALENETVAIREELLTVLSQRECREPVFDSAPLAQANLRSAQGAAVWDGFYFYRHGRQRNELANRCPRTKAAIDRLPLARIRDHAPETMFSVLEPGTHLLRHRGVTNTRVVCHLPLIVPPDCALDVADQIHEWKEGSALVFDDTYEHEAWNRSDRTRVVLICDIWNPHLDEAERVAVTHLVEAIGDFRCEVEREGDLA